MKRYQSRIAALMVVAVFVALLTGTASARPSTTPTNLLKSIGQLGYASPNTTISATSDPTIFKIEHTLNAYITPGSIAIVIVLDNSGSMGNPYSTLVTTTGGHPVYDANLLPLEYLVDANYRNFFPTGASYHDPASGSTFTSTGNNTNWRGGGYRWEWAVWGASEATKVFLDETTGLNPRAKDTAVAFVAFGSTPTPVFSENFHVSNNSTMNVTMGTNYNFAGDYSSATNGALRYIESKLTQRSASSTNIQAGLIAAYDYLRGISADRKFVLFLGDGEPNGGSQETNMQVAAAIKGPVGGPTIAGRSPIGAEIYAINLASVYDRSTNTDLNTAPSNWLSGSWLRDGIYGTNGTKDFGSEQTLIALASVLGNSYYNTAANFASGGLNANASAIQSNINFAETEKRYVYVRQSSTNPTPAQATKDAFRSFAQTILDAGSGAQMTAELNSMYSVVSYQGGPLFTTSTTDTSAGATGGTATLNGSTITWKIGEAPNGETLKLSYYVQMNTSGLSAATFYAVLTDAYLTYTAGGSSYCVNYPLPYARTDGQFQVNANNQDATIGDNSYPSGGSTPTPTPTPIDHRLSSISPSSRPRTSPAFIFDNGSNGGNVSPGQTPPPAVVALQSTVSPVPTGTVPPLETATPSPAPAVPTPTPLASSETGAIAPVMVNEETTESMIPLTDGILLVPLVLLAVLGYSALHTQRRKRQEQER